MDGLAGAARRSRRVETAGFPAGDVIVGARRLRGAVPGVTLRRPWTAGSGCVSGPHKGGYLLPCPQLRGCSASDGRCETDRADDDRGESIWEGGLVPDRRPVTGPPSRMDSPQPSSASIRPLHHLPSPSGGVLGLEDEGKEVASAPIDPDAHRLPAVHGFEVAPGRHLGRRPRRSRRRPEAGGLRRASGLHLADDEAVHPAGIIR